MNIIQIKYYRTRFEIYNLKFNSVGGVVCACVCVLTPPKLLDLE